jgi:P27 family predicted phage terminase small subunit
MGSRGPVSGASLNAGKKHAKGVCAAPAYISVVAQGYYALLSQGLSERLEPEDTHVLAQCAQAMSEIAEANKQLSEHGYVSENSQGPCMSVWVKVRALAHKEFQIASQKLGLSPADRARLIGSLSAPEPEGGPSDFTDKHGNESA